MSITAFDPPGSNGTNVISREHPRLTRLVADALEQRQIRQQQEERERQEAERRYREEQKQRHMEDVCGILSTSLIEQLGITPADDPADDDLIAQWRLDGQTWSLSQSESFADDLFHWFLRAPDGHELDLGAVAAARELDYVILCEIGDYWTRLSALQAFGNPLISSGSNGTHSGHAEDGEDGNGGATW